MLVLVVKVVLLVVLLVASALCVWFSTPWGYKRPLYRRVVKESSILDNPNLLRALGLGGFLYGLFGGFWSIASTLDQLHLLDRH
jgi:hypothetical protein